MTQQRRQALALAGIVSAHGGMGSPATTVSVVGSYRLRAQGDG